LISLPLRMRRAIGQARTILRQQAADVVVGFGGYAALPVCLAARQLRLPVVIHEANAVPGLTNRIVARFATVVCVTFADTGLPRPVLTGMPVRAAVADLDRCAGRLPARRQFGLDDQATVLLVTGGSQGARSINDATLAALPDLLSAGISVLHVTGPKNFDQPITVEPSQRARYVRLPYVEQMGQAYAAADLMLARSGAATVTETALVGLPAILVPLPHGNGEQAKNAAGLLAAGAARLIDDADLTGSRLLATVTELCADPAALARMSQAAADAMPRHAADTVAGYVLGAGATASVRGVD
jgi:UDP-N-acetylglucosamine--N-acetylmuramyl-(pentapeptide) pyrophosphoryl-undecaprenol N-acetylglucosamine transferase